MAEAAESTRSEGLSPSADSPLPDMSFDERYPARSDLAVPGGKLPDNTYGPLGTGGARGPLDAVDPMADTSGLASSLARATERRMGNDAFAIAEADRYRTEDRERARKAYDATGVGPDATPKWDADAESARYSTSPIAKFGSLGSVVGMLASAFTHHPMQNAMNASAAAMNAIGEHDAEGYQRAHTAWKENTDLVFKRADLEQKRFNDAIRLMDTDANIAAAKLRENAVMEGDEKALAMLNAGMIPELVKYKSDQATAIEKLIKARDDIERTGWADAYTKPMIKEAQEQYKNDPEKLAGAMMHIAQMKGFLKDDDIDRQALGNWMAKRLKDNNFEAIPFEEVTAKIQELAAAKNPWRAGGGLAKPPIAGSKSSIIQNLRTDIQKENETWSPGQVDQEALKRYQQASAKPIAEGVVLSDEDAKFLGQQLAAGDTSVLTNLGRGAQGAANVLKVRHMAAEEMTSRKLSGEDMAHVTAAFQGEKAAQRAAGTRESAVTIAAIEANKMMVVAHDASMKVERTQFVPLNKLMQTAAAAWSDPNLKAFRQANDTLVNGYVRAVSPTGVPTDIVRKHAYDTLSTADSKEAYEAVLRVMRQEMVAAVASPKEMRELLLHSKDATEKVGADITSARDSNLIRYDAEGKRIK